MLPTAYTVRERTLGGGALKSSRTCSVPTASHFYALGKRALGDSISIQLLTIFNVPFDLAISIKDFHENVKQLFHEKR
mgnify:CR=1 FL=1